VRGKADAALAVLARRALRVAKSVSQSHTTRHASRPFRMTAGSTAITSIPICREWGGVHAFLVQYMTYNKLLDNDSLGPQARFMDKKHCLLHIKSLLLKFKTLPPECTISDRL